MIVPEAIDRAADCYLRLIDASSRMIRAGRASLEAETAPIFERLGLDQHVLESTVSKLFEPATCLRRIHIDESVLDQAGQVDPRSLWAIAIRRSRIWGAQRRLDPRGRFS